MRSAYRRFALVRLAMNCLGIGWHERISSVVESDNDAKPYAVLAQGS